MLTPLKSNRADIGKVQSFQKETLERLAPVVPKMVNSLNWPEMRLESKALLPVRLPPRVHRVKPWKKVSHENRGLERLAPVRYRQKIG